MSSTNPASQFYDHLCQIAESGSQPGQWIYKPSSIEIMDDMVGALMMLPPDQQYRFVCETVVRAEAASRIPHSMSYHFEAELEPGGYTPEKPAYQRLISDYRLDCILMFALGLMTWIIPLGQLHSSWLLVIAVLIVVEWTSVPNVVKKHWPKTPR